MEMSGKMSAASGLNGRVFILFGVNFSRVANGIIDRVGDQPRGVKTVLQIDPHSGIPLLTAREHQVLALIAQGLSAKEAAQAIDIAPRTVERHIENLRLKLRARNRTHMVTLALEFGLLSIDNAEAA